MKFKEEDELDIWFAEEKERLSDAFMNKIDGDKENTQKYKDKFNAEMKKLLAKYTAEYEKFIQKKPAKKKEE